MGDRDPDNRLEA